VNVFRDVLMAGTFLVFLRCEFGISQFANESSRGRRLFIVNLGLAVVLVVLIHKGGFDVIETCKMESART
jgi:hypothetical protein